MSYKKETSQIIQNGIISGDRIFNYFETPHESRCNNLFLYYKKLIENNSDLYNIETNFFFFNNNTNVNAWAQISGKNTIISINIIFGNISF